MNMVVPSPELLSRWGNGGPSTDEELAEIERFFGAMVAGMEALGDRYSLAAIVLRMEHDRATRIQGYRRT